MKQNNKMEIWEGIKNIFKKKVDSPVKEEESKAIEGEVTSTSPSFEIQDKPLLLDSQGNQIICDLCKEPLHEGEQKTFNSKKLHIRCFRKGMKAYKRSIGL